MTMQLAVYFVLILLVARLMADKVRNPGYKCPSCGTARVKEHADDCAWKKHYGEEF